MAAVACEVKTRKTTVTTVDLAREAQSWVERSSGVYTSTAGSASDSVITIKAFHPSFVKDVVGDDHDGDCYCCCTHSLVSESFGNASRNPFFYKACAYLPDVDELYTTSDLLQSTTSSRLPVILISKLSFHRQQGRQESDAGSTTTAGLEGETTSTCPPAIDRVEWTKLRPPASMPMPSGAIPYKDGVLYCSQGTLADPASGGLHYMPLGKRPVPIVTNYFGKPFNSIQSVVADKHTQSGDAFWFTDSCAGYEMEIRPAPRLPSHVYWFDPANADLRVVADDLLRPSGIALDPAGGTLYVTDTEAARPGNDRSATSPATIYAYDILRRPAASPSLVNRRVFAFAFSGVPTSVVCDVVGNVYAACGDGVEVWNAGGTALGVIEITGS